MPSSGYRKTTADFGQMSRDLQSAAASFGQMTSAAGAFVTMVHTFAEFENRIIRVNALAGGTAKNLQDLSDSARNIALTTKYSASEAAEAMTLLAQAGFSTKETIEAIPEVLKLAQASMEDINVVSDMVASTLRTFNLEVEETSRVVNVFAAANAKSLASVNKLAFSMRQVGPVASEFGLSLEETTGALSVLYNRGLRGEQAGTALRNIIVRLIKPTKELKETFDSLGLAMRDERGAYSLQQLLSQLRTAGVSDEQLTKMFGREALAGAKTLIAATAGEWDAMTEKITGTDEATRQYAEQLKSLKNQLAMAKNAFDELMLSMGTTVAPIIKDIAETVRNLALWFRNLDDDSKENIGSVLKWAGALLALKSGLNIIISLLGKAKASYLGFSAAVSKAYKLITENRYMDLKALRDSMSEQIRLWEIGSQKGTDWYVRMNEHYKSLHKGANMSMKAANGLKNLTAAQVADLKMTKAAASGWKLFTAELKAFAIQAASLSAMFAGGLMVAEGFKELFGGKKTLTEEEKAGLFPELTALQEKVLQTDKIVTDTLPKVVRKIKEAQANLKEVSEIKAESPFGLLEEATKGWSESQAEKAANALYVYFYNALYKGVEPTRREIRNVLKSVNLPEELDKALLESFKKNKENHWNVLGGYRLSATEMVQEVLGLQYGEFQKKAKEEAEASKKAIEKAFNDAFKNTTTVKKRFYKDPSKISDKEANEAVRAWVYGLTGIDIPEKEDAIRYIKENQLFIKDAVLKALSDPAAVQRAGEILTEGGTGVVQQYKLGEGVIGVEIVPQLTDEQKDKLKKAMQQTAAIVAQQTAIDNLKTTYAGLINDFTKQWGIINKEIYAKVQTTALDLQQEKLKTDNYKAQVKLLEEVYEKSGLAFGLNTEITKEYLNQNGILSDIGKDKIKKILDNLKSIKEEARGVSEEDLALAYGLIEQLVLNGKITQEKLKQLEAEKALYAIQNGEITNLKKYRDALDQIIKTRDESATTENTWEQFVNGLGTGVLAVEKDIDHFYDMGKKGMQGFADYMTDSMNNVVDAWGKGWSSMKDALKNTLTDMLKDLAHYYMKQAIYMGITSLAGGLFESSSLSWGVDQFGNAAPKPIPLPSFKQAKGGAWTNGLQTFANGGVVTSPTLFNTRSGKGLMGEAGPEAIMPLRRDSQGRLGVSVAGGSTMNYAPTFNINMTTGQVDSETSQRNTNRMTKELDSKVKNAVLLVLAKEKRPGGLLYGR